MVTLLILAAVAACLFIPFKKPDGLFIQPASPPKPDSRQAIDSLLAVRASLSASGAISDESEKAIDTLWLDLLHGSQSK